MILEQGLITVMMLFAPMINYILVEKKIKLQLLFLQSVLGYLILMEMAFYPEVKLK